MAAKETLLAINKLQEIAVYFEATAIMDDAAQGDSEVLSGISAELLKLASYWATHLEKQAADVAEAMLKTALVEPLTAQIAVIKALDVPYLDGQVITALEEIVQVAAAYAGQYSDIFLELEQHEHGDAWIASIFYLTEEGY